MLLLQQEMLVYADQRAIEMLCIPEGEIGNFSQQELLERFSPQDRESLLELLVSAQSGALNEPVMDLYLAHPDGTCYWVDLLVAGIQYQGEPAIQVNLIDNTPRREVEDRLRSHIERLEALHEIELATLSIQGEQAIAEAALHHIARLAPHYWGSSVVLIDRETNQGSLLAFDSRESIPEPKKGVQLSPDDLTVDNGRVQEGKFLLLENLCQLSVIEPLQQRIMETGSCSFLSVPLRWGGGLIGTLNLASDQRGVYQPEHLEIAQEVADTLALAIQQARLRKAEQQRRQEAEVMRDLMTSLAGAGNLKQTLETILVNLHNVIHYDRAGLFLAEEDDRFVKVDRSLAREENVPRTYLEEDPLVSEMRSTRKSLLVSDVQADKRFENWPDIQPVQSWLGAPLMVGEEMLGFLSLGSLSPDAYSPSDADLVQAFASQVAQVLEKAWLDEQSQRRTEEMEVLSTITFALGQVEGGEKTLNTIIEQLARFFSASRGAFLFPDKTGSTLTLKVSTDESTVGAVHSLIQEQSSDIAISEEPDLLWNVFLHGQTSVIDDTQKLIRPPCPAIYPQLWKGCQSAVLIPLKSGDAIFGVLSFGFEIHRKFSNANIRLYNTVADIAGASLRRAVVLEALERQVTIRTQHLSTLYNINAVASEPLELQAILDHLLDITLQSMNSDLGSIHFLNEKGGELYLVAQKNLPQQVLPYWVNLSLQEDFWQDLMHTSNPLVITDMESRAEAPLPIHQMDAQGKKAFIGAPIRAKGQVLGLLSMFGETIQDYTIEDITLFMTIADQIGSSVERARLMKQAELAAVVQERQRLARELHDSVTQLLYGQVLFSGAGLKVLQQGNVELTEQHLSRIDQAAQQALKEMRLLLYELRPSDILEEGLVSALQRRLDAVEKRTGINAQLTVNGDLNLDASTEMALYRIAEEALNNTLKHANATAVKVMIDSCDGRMLLEIEDNGKGFELSEKGKGGGMGLVNMCERATALGGELEILTALNQGTKIILSLEVSKA
jgi:signal transduction histidine kinase